MILRIARLAEGRSRSWLALFIVAALVAGGCSESASDDAGGSGADVVTEDDVGAEPDVGAEDEVAGEDEVASELDVVSKDDVVSEFGGQEWFMGTLPTEAVTADESLEPIKIGMINQENTPLGSFPELRGSVEAAAAWVNAELGGVDGRPIEIVSCITSFSVEQSQACAQDMVQANVVALVGGIDVTSNGSIPVLEQNGIPVIGGIPANLVEQKSPINFFFSGGAAGGMAAMIAHAQRNGADRVMIAYGEFESFEVTARDFAAKVAESLGLAVELRSFPITSADMLPILTAAETSDVDALIVAAADTSCVPVMEGAKQLELRAQIYLVGACAVDPVLEAAGPAAAGVIYSGEGPADADNVEGSIFDAATAMYATGPAGGAGTVGFRGFMNLYSLLVELGADNITSQSITDLVSAAVDRPSFWGHSYTCDGNRIPGLPALCAPEQSLFMTTGVVGEDLVFLPEDFPETDGWIETDDLYNEALGS